MAVSQTPPVFLHEILELAAAERPDDLALVTDGRRLTFAQLAARVVVLARWTAERTSPGDRVVLIADNHLDVVAALYAVPAAGAVLTFSNTRHTPAEVDDLIATTGPTLVLAGADQLDRLSGHLAERTGLGVWSIGGQHDAADGDLTRVLDDTLGAMTHPGPGGTGPAGTGPTGAVDGSAGTTDSLDDCAWLIHTSGTTGRPKGVVLTHRSLAAGVANSAIARPLADDDVYLFPFPLFHVAAYNVLHAHLRRRPVVLVPRFDAAAVLNLIRDEGVTCCSLAPTMLAMLLDHPGRTASSLTGLRQISYGASAMPLDLLRRVLAELPDCGLAQGYGMTELSGNAVFLTPDDHRRAATDEPELLAAAGRPGPLVALRIVDEQDRTVAPGAPGEILVRGDQVCAGYWNDPDATAAARVGPWFRTGDVGRISDGMLFVVDRKKDLIITGGENVASREVEDVLSEHPAVGQVAVVGVQDDRWGEAVCAVVVPSPGASPDPEELVTWTRGRMAGFKRPRRVVLVDALPLNASGKVDKARVRATLAAPT
jgi:acyl-CoA synthetase (AMP-forming)/AMP-acid ligase II